MAIFLFPIVVDEMQAVYPEVAEVFQLMGYVFRAYSMDGYQDPASGGEGPTRTRLLDRLYRKMSRAFKEETSTFNMHLISHAEEWVELGSAHVTSAFRFERSYAKMKKVMRYVNHYHLRRAIIQAFQTNGLSHNCVKSVKFTGFTRQSNDSLIYTERNGAVQAFQVISELGDQTYLCAEQRLDRHCYLCPGNLVFERTVIDFTRVGVYKAGPVSRKTEIVSEEDIRGKFMEVEDYIVLVPLELIHETQ